MKLITRDSDYAVRAICSIAKNEGKIIPVSRLNRELKIPRAFLRKILQLLHKSGLLKAHKGNGGGFELARPLEEIFLVDVMRIFQGPLQLNECLFNKRVCSNRGTCILRSKIRQIESRVISELASISLKSLLLTPEEADK